MIFAEVHGSRTFVGCLDHGSEVIASLLALCKDKGIDCGYISGYGYVEDPKIRQFSRSEKKYLPGRKQEGLFVTSSLQGSISTGDKDKPTLQLFCQLAASGRGRTKAVAGQLVSASVLQVEFVIHTVDNVELLRLNEKETGLDVWLQLLPAGVGSDYAAPGPRSRQQLFRGPQPSRSEEEDDYNDDDINIRGGDWLDHPRLGMCYVMTYDGEDRIKVRLQSGRIAELLVSMFRLSLGGVKEGGKIYKVEMRKRK